MTLHRPFKEPPRRLILGDVQMAEVLDLLVALNSGKPYMPDTHPTP